MERTKLEITPIAVIHTPFREKFGIPRQSGLSGSIVGRIVFMPEYRNPDAIRGLDGFSHLWLIFDFTKSHREKWSPTVRPPRLGGNTHVGVFASRSPFRPNPLGLSSVKLERIIKTREQGTVLEVSGVDLLDGTLIYDIKPYIPYSDSHPDAESGYSVSDCEYKLNVEISDELSGMIEENALNGIIACLSADPRPSYHEYGREYTMAYSDYEISFKVNEKNLTVTKVLKIKIGK